MSDKELLELLARDPNRYFYLVVEAYNHLMLSTLRRKIRSEQDAEDALQRLWVRVYTYFKGASREEVLAIANLRAWLSMCARRAVADYFRERGRHQVLESTDALQEVNIDIAGEDCDAPEEIVIHGEEIQRVFEAIKKVLRGKERQALLLTLQGYNYKTIANLMGIKKEYVGNLVSTARSQLCKLFPEYCPKKRRSPEKQ